MIVKSGVRLVIGFLFLFGLSACDKQAEEVTWGKIFSAIENKFPEVPQLSTEELNAWIYGDERKAPLLLDARRSDEYEVSRLEGAHLYSAPQVKGLLASTPKDRTIVVYCSVGWRSAEVVHHLQKLGYTNSYNLKGSIFEWANHEKPLVNESGPTRWVHPYGNPWITLLKPEYRSVKKD